MTLHVSHLPSRPAPLSSADIYENICVQPSYFALQDLEIADPDGEVTAKIPVQLELNRPGDLGGSDYWAPAGATGTLC